MLGMLGWMCTWAQCVKCVWRPHVGFLGCPLFYPHVRHKCRLLQVVMVANQLPAINDITADELKEVSDVWLMGLCMF